MSDQGVTPQNPAPANPPYPQDPYATPQPQYGQQQYPPQAQYPPNAQYPPQPQYAPVPPVPGAPYPAPPKRKRGWVIWVIVISLLAFLGTCCVVPILLVTSFEDSSIPTFGEGVAVIHIDGVIAGTGDIYSGYITPEYILDQLDQAEYDDSVKAVVLRVDSPGGTVAASEEIASMVKDYKKPIIVSIGDVGASGAYMVSSQADEIWAMPGSAVGSIGVISEIPNVKGLLDKVGVEFTVITAGKYKDTGSPYRPLTEEEKSLIQGEVDEAYGQFVGIVAEGRDLPRSKVESMATGQTWSGSRAKKLGLIDEIGTYQDALDAAAKAGGIEGDYDIISFESGDDFVNALLGITSRFDGLQALIGGNRPAGREALTH